MFLTKWNRQNLVEAYMKCSCSTGYLSQVKHNGFFSQLLIGVDQKCVTTYRIQQITSFAMYYKDYKKENIIESIHFKSKHY